ncbi:MAG: sulfurtransferase [Planctomycetes bacterium]|jgi:rhodanese-related sulfurtransferase|nr:sulfurtransferase [Planctomycetota bacterium]
MDEVRAGSSARALIQQGYDYSPGRLRELSWALRFTPLVCMAAALVGLATREPAIHFALAALGMLPFWMPAAHPVDRFYNHVLRPLWRGVKLPPNPLPRRIACFMGGATNLGIALAFVAGNVPLAYLLGGMLVVLQLIVITTHFCVASWMYEIFLRALGLWVPTVPLAEARELLAAGAELIDVREPDEFAGNHLPGSRNVPLAGVVDGLADSRDRTLLLYCVSGMRSQRAVRRLRREGFEQIHNLGAMEKMQGDRG